jgi:hypothetical protein
VEKRYFHFPLCLLSFGQDVYERLNGIVALGCVELGRKQWETFSQNGRAACRSFQPSPHLCKCRIDLGKDAELQVVAGCDYLNLVCQNAKAILDGYSRVTRFIKDFERKHGTDARVRIRTDWLFEVRDNKGMSYSELIVLAAIYSKIGASKKPVRITREDIWKRAHGFKSDRVFRAEMNGRSPFLSERQVRSTIERLHGRKFFARTTYGRRQTYYSHRLNSTQLAEEVFILKTKWHIVRRARISADADLTKRIQAERRKCASGHASNGATNPPL